MRKYALLLLLAGMLTACNTGYTIKGNIEGENSGNMLLLRSQGTQIDTIGIAPIVNGVFNFTGKVEEITEAFLTQEGKWGNLFIMLENAKYTATINTKKPAESVVEGTVNQDVLNQFSALVKERDAIMEEVRDSYTEAMNDKNTELLESLGGKANEVFQSYWEKQKQLLKKYPDAYMSLYIIAQSAGSIEYEDLHELYGALSKRLKEDELGMDINTLLERMAVVAIGKVAPDFSLRTSEETTVSLHKDIKGKVKIVDFWASWCTPCRQSNPGLIALYKRYQDKGLAMLSVSVDSKEDLWHRAIKEDRLPWTQAIDNNNTVAALYNVIGIPHIIILDENNTIIAKNLRGKKLEEKIVELLR